MSSHDIVIPRAMTAPRFEEQEYLLHQSRQIQPNAQETGRSGAYMHETARLPQQTNRSLMHPSTNLPYRPFSKSDR